MNSTETMAASLKTERGSCIGIRRHRYTPSAFQELAENAGLTVTGLHDAHGRSRPIDTEVYEYIFRLQAARPAV